MLYEVTQMDVIRAHFDGHNIIPDEPVQLEVGQELEIVVRKPAGNQAKSVPVNDALAALRWLADTAVKGANIPDDELRRERLYEDRAS
jgi:hypothetical protein